MTSDTPRVEGSCDPRFAAVRDAFAENFTLREEVGAGVTVILGGRMVVDLWGGLADRKTGRTWTRDTTVMVFSSTKGATALCAHYWPEFAAAGKEALPVRMLLNHRAGLPAIEPVMAEDKSERKRRKKLQGKPLWVAVVCRRFDAHAANRPSRDFFAQ